MKYAVVIEKLVKRFKGRGSAPDKVALQELDLAIPQGSLLGLLGPNGAGKSMLINIMAGTVIKTSGRVLINGYDIDQTPKMARSQIGIVPQELVLDNFFPISQTLEFTAGYYGVRPQHRRTNEILQALGLFDKKNALPKQLSGGMKRRLLVAKAMVHSPPILILDEPTAGIDLELREQLWAYIKKLNSQGTTIVITTHYLAEAQELCSDIAFINNGKIIKLDSKENLLSTLGTRHIEVEFDQDITATDLNSVADHPFTILSDRRIRFLLLNNTKDQLGRILARIQQLKVSVKDLQISQPELESIFKELIKN